MTASTLETISSYQEQFEAEPSVACKRQPRSHRKSATRFAKRGRNVELGAKGRNRSRSVHVTMR